MYATLGITAEHFRRTYFKQLRKAVNDYDRQILLRPDFETAFCDASAECFAQGSDGLVRDAELLYRSWAFDVTQSNGESTCGKERTIACAGRHQQGGGRPDAGTVWHPVEGAGHFVAVGAADEVFAIAAEELGA